MSKIDGRLANWYFALGVILTAAQRRRARLHRWTRLRLCHVADRAGHDHLVEAQPGLARAGRRDLVLGAWYAATEVVGGVFGNTGGARLVTNIMDMIGSFLIVMGLTMLVRRRRNLNAGAVIGDALIVGLGSWLMSWVAFLQPTLAFSTEPLISSLIEGLYQPTGSVILFLMAVYLFTETGRNASSLLRRRGGAVGAGRRPDVLARRRRSHRRVDPDVDRRVLHARLLLDRSRVPASGHQVPRQRRGLGRLAAPARPADHHHVVAHLPGHRAGIVGPEGHRRSDRPLDLGTRPGRRGHSARRALGARELRRAARAAQAGADRRA